MGNYWKGLWITYFIVLLIVIIYNCVNFSNSIILIATIVFTIIAMFLVMIQNNENIRKSTRIYIEALRESTKEQINTIQLSSNNQIEKLQNINNKQIKTILSTTNKQVKVIKETSEKQITNMQDSTKNQILSYIEQCQGIISRLENVAEVLITMSEQNQEKLEIERRKNEKEEENYRKLLMDNQQQLIEKQDIIERIKPNIVIRIGIVRRFLLFPNYKIYFFNTGGDGNNFKISIVARDIISNNLTQPINQKFESINREQEISYWLGHVQLFNSYNDFIINISIRDKEDRLYVGNIIISKNNENWTQLIMKREINGNLIE